MTTPDNIPPFSQDEEDRNETIFLANTNDQAAREDSLGFAPYVTAVADFLTSKDTRPPLVLSVEGEWGSGKTSFMRQLEHALREEHKQRFTVWFNPWRHDNEEAVWAAFVIQFVNNIARQQWFGRRWIGHFRLFLYRFKWQEGWLDFLWKITLWLIILGLTIAIGIAAYLNNGLWTQQLTSYASLVASTKKMEDLISVGIKAGGISAYVFLWLSVLRKIEALFGDPLKIDLKRYINTPNYEERISFVERFHEDFQHILESYVGEETVYVFIDDVDRCEVPKAADLMSSLNLMVSGDVRIVFIIGMDREKVAAGLAVKHEKLLPYLYLARYDNPDDQDKENRVKMMGLEFGYEFIEKFVQLPFILPHPDETVLGNFLQKISGKTEALTLSQKPRQGWANRLFNPSPPRPAQSLVTPASESANPAPAQKQRRESVIIQAGTDSERIHSIIKVVAPAFENNPRRLKQFINLFRLRVYIAAETGLFDRMPQSASADTPASRLNSLLKGSDESDKTVYSVPLTLEQLGKFVAINLRWPLLVADLETFPTLLQDLQKIAIEPQAEVPSYSGRLSRWKYRSDLMNFLRAGIPSSETKTPWSLANVNTAELMRVSPRVRRVIPPIVTVVKKRDQPLPKAARPTIRKPEPKPQGTDYSALGLAPPVTQTVTSYLLGDDLYDDSFSIDASDGSFLGEYGVGISETIGVGDPKKTTALEVWLFDKNDIRTVTKVLMSAHAFNDATIRGRLESKGELVMIEPQTQVLLETETLQLLATVADLQYGQGAMPPQSYFERLTLELAVWPKSL